MAVKRGDVLPIHNLASIHYLIGPDTWHEDFPVAKEGKRQSPIDLKTDVDVEETFNTPPLAYNYIPANNVDIENTGASWKVNVESNVESSK